MTSADNVGDALALIRGELAELLSKLDTAAPPPPDRMCTDNPQKLGAEWRPADRWIVRTIDTGPGVDTVYVETPDSTGGDMLAYDLAQARTIGMALLAAADWAEHHRGEVRVLRPRHRRTGRNFNG